MNELMILGLAIMALGIIVCFGIYYKVCYKNNNRKAYVRFLILLILIAFSLLGGALAQAGADKARLEFTTNELALMKSGKTYSQLPEEEKQLFVALKSKYLLNEEEKVAEYHDIILNLAIDEYLEQNKHRPELTKEDAKKFILEDWKGRRDFNKSR